jgi:hypothetical protein
MRRRNSHVSAKIVRERAGNDRSGALGACGSGCLFSGVPPAADVVVSEEATYIATPTDDAIPDSVPPLCEAAR